MKGAAPNAMVFSEPPARLPDGFGACPLDEAQQAAAMRLCVVVRTIGAKSSEAGPFVILRETLDARVYLGCVTDRGGRVHRWVEIWVQDVTGLSRAVAGYREILNNSILDERWTERCEWFDRMKGEPNQPFGTGGIIRTGWESEHAAPIVIDTKKLEPVRLRDPRTGASWMLCREDAVLTGKGAPAYSTSTRRFLWQPESGEQSAILEVDESGLDLNAAGANADCVALNPAGGLMMVLPYAPMSYEQYVDALTGGAGDSPAGGELQKLLTAATVAGGAERGGWLMLTSNGRESKLVETLHLKLMAFAGAVAAVRGTLQSTQTPLLTLSAQSFRVKTADGPGIAPLWWTARVGLVQPGESVELPVPGTDVKYYLGGRPSAVTIYAPATIGRQSRGTGWIRLRSVTPGSQGVVLEGTLTTQERVTPGTNDLVWMRFTVGVEKLDIYAMIDASQAMAAGEVRFRTSPHALSDDAFAELKGALGAPIQDVAFELVPLVSSPCDMYALGVLAVRTLIADGRRPLPAALDEVLSLAGQAASLASDGGDLVSRIGTIMASDARFAEALGPHRLLFDSQTVAETFEIIPPALWNRVLAMIVRMLTGVGADAICRDFGDAPQGGIHKIFDAVSSDLYALLVACRSLIVPDHAQRNELRSVVTGCLATVRGG